MAPAVGRAASEPMKAIVAAYLEIQSQLAADKTDTVKEKARAIVEQAARLPQAGTAVAAAAAGVEKAADITAVRDAFGGLSTAVIAAAKADGWTDVSGLKMAYCPMVKQSWLQAQDRSASRTPGSRLQGVEMGCHRLK